MAGKNTAAFGIYPNQSALECGIAALRDANFRAEDISVLYPENIGTKDFAHEKDTKALPLARLREALWAVCWAGLQV
jgi:hypothetical protein